MDGGDAMHDWLPCMTAWDLLKHGPLDSTVPRVWIEVALLSADWHVAWAHSMSCGITDASDHQGALQPKWKHGTSSNTSAGLIYQACCKYFVPSISVYTHKPPFGRYALCIKNFFHTSEEYPLSLNSSGQSIFLYLLLREMAQSAEE